MGFPLIGRVAAIISFFLVSTREQSVICYTFIQRLANDLRERINLAEERLAGDVYFDIPDDGIVCAAWAEKGYDPDTVARSLEKLVTKMVSQNFIRAYLEDEATLMPQPWGTSLKRFVVKVRTAGEAPNPLVNFSVIREGSLELKFGRLRIIEPLFIDDGEVYEDRCQVLSDGGPCIAVDHGSRSERRRRFRRKVN
jgi:hypothetical protein